jgi:hypothetical protein
MLLIFLLSTRKTFCWKTQRNASVCLFGCKTQIYTKILIKCHVFDRLSTLEKLQFIITKIVESRKHRLKQKKNRKHESCSADCWRLKFSLLLCCSFDEIWRDSFSPFTIFPSPVQCTYIWWTGEWKQTADWTTTIIKNLWWKKYENITYA